MKWILIAFIALLAGCADVDPIVIKSEAPIIEAIILSEKYNLEIFNINASDGSMEPLIPTSLFAGFALVEKNFLEDAPNRSVNAFWTPEGYFLHRYYKNIFGHTVSKGDGNKDYDGYPINEITHFGTAKYLILFE